MDSSSSILEQADGFDFCLSDLKDCAFPENEELLLKCEAVVSHLVRQLKPILKYIAKPRRFGPLSDSKKVHLLGPLASSRVSPNTSLFLHTDGTFALYRPDGGEFLVLVIPQGKAHHAVLFSDLLLGLQSELKEWEAKRRRNLTNIHGKLVMIDKVIEDLGIKRAPRFASK
jgi:hypothetical protein